MIQRLVLLVIFISLTSGCAKIFGGLRRDLDDSAFTSSPTTGGRWSEREYLAGSNNGDYYTGPVAVGHSERSPASAIPSFHESAGSWLTPEQADQNRRDAYRQEIENRTESETALEVDADSEGSISRSPSSDLTPRQFKNGPRATKSDFMDDATHTGSLWASDGQTNYYFLKNKVRSMGDIITINVEQELFKDILTEVSRTLSIREKETEIAAAQERLRAKALGLSDPTVKQDSLTTTAAAPARASGVESTSIDDNVQIPVATLADIDLTRSVELKTGDQFLGEIVERFPNGNYKIRATKRLRYRNDMRMLTLVGVVRGTDISEEDLLNSGRLYEYRLEILR